jgi:hypothetical protein
MWMWRRHITTHTRATNRTALFIGKEQPLKNPAAVALGKLGGKIGGKATSKRKAAAARKNGKLGGRPRRAAIGEPKAAPEPTGQGDVTSLLREGQQRMRDMIAECEERGEKDRPFVIGCLQWIGLAEVALRAAHPGPSPEALLALKKMADMFRTFIEEVESVGGMEQPHAWTVYHDALAALSAPPLAEPDCPFHNEPMHNVRDCRICFPAAPRQGDGEGTK